MPLSDDLTRAGGTAFPTSSDHVDEGMTLRDYFAGQAINGFCAVMETAGRLTSVPAFAVKAYEVADAMLKARQS